MIRNKSRTLLGHVAVIYRYPVKSMQGERLERVNLGPDGLDGDRRFAVIDAKSGRVASAKNPRKWAKLLELQAKLRDEVLTVSAPDGSEYQGNLDTHMSNFLGQNVWLRGAPQEVCSIEIEWPDVPGHPQSASESIEILSPGGYFDLAPVHLITTATLARFGELAPECDFSPQRFRPNVVIETLPAFSGFVEHDWIGRTLALGELPLRVTAPCSRCVMTTLSQPGLSADPKILRTTVIHNGAHVGVYARPVRRGEVETGIPVWLV